MKLANRASRKLCCIIALLLTHAPTVWEVSVKDSKLYVKVDGTEYALTKSGDRKLYGAQNQEELVFVPGKNGKIAFLFTGLYGAKKVVSDTL